MLTKKQNHFLQFNMLHNTFPCAPLVYFPVVCSHARLRDLLRFIEHANKIDKIIQ